MNRQIFTVASIALTIVSLGIVAFDWSSRASEQTSAKPRAAKQVAQPQTDDAASANSPDTRRDIFIAANRAPRAAEIGSGTWFNSAPLNLKGLHGKVVLVDFWTFGCYNCRNTLPTLKRLNSKYSGKGLTIIGVHAPESDYEKNMENVRREVQKLGIKYPVVTDNDYQTWHAYNIQAWPTIVILDKQGRIRFTHIGEGYYEQQEQIIQELLAEKSADVQTKNVMPEVDSTR